MSNLQNIKGSRTRVLNTFPTKDFGNDGDIVISRIKGKGVFLCSKAGGMWYAASQMEELKKAGKLRADSLLAGKLEVSSMINSEITSDKFIVNENGKIKYRTKNQVIDDLSLPFNNIAYKTAYCSLGQHSNKETCELNGGTWYYSENDSHDSISSTPENQLLTVGQSIGSVDVEPTLTYDGSILEIKRNTNFDENWYTSAQSNLLKLSYDSDNSSHIGVNSSGDMNFTLNKEDASFSFIEGGAKRLSINTGDGLLKLHNPVSTGAGILEYFSIDIDDNAVTTIKTEDSGGTAGHLTLDIDGDIELNADGGDITFKDDSASLATINGDGLTINNIGTDSAGDNYLVEVSGLVKKRTPAEVLSDIGAQASGSYITGSGSLSAQDLTDIGNLSGTNTGDQTLPTNYVTNDASDTMSGTLSLSGGDLKVDATRKIILDGNTVDAHTYIAETSADTLRIFVGGDTMMQFSEKGADGNEVSFGSSCVGFTQLEPTYDATDTAVDFRHSNKQNLTFGAGSITNVRLFFPLVSGNFQLLIKQDGTGSRTITNYKVYEFDESAADGSNAAVFAGGSNPTLTTDANHVDILSFYWDADNEIAYGVATLDFQF